MGSQYVCVGSEETQLTREFQDILIKLGNT